MLWSLTYTAVGLLGDSIFPDAQTAVIAAVVGAVLLTVLAQLVQKLRHRTQ